jgi:hypothetical protein
LEQLKSHPILDQMELIRQSRLSVCPVTDEQWHAILALADGGPSGARPAKKAATTKKPATKATTKATPEKNAEKNAKKPATKEKATAKKPGRA